VEKEEYVKYYVKAPFSGWHEVTEERYYKYIKLLNEQITALTGKEKEERINKRTRIEKD